jgi:putative spermidine/putrescine transport system ATP-binding protein
MSFLEINNISKKFGATEAVSDFNLHVEKGELVSFLGPSGCGKTTTLRMVAGFETPTSGQIVMNGHDITEMPSNQRDVGMVFQSYALFPNMTVAGNIGFGLKVKKKSTDEINQRVGEMLGLINMPEYAHRYPYQLSGGQQQRVALARALALRPDMLLLDEPLSALDAKIRVSLRSEIRAIQQKLGITAIYVTHDQEEALSLSDRVVVMHDGKMEQVGTPFEVYNFPTTRFVANFVGTLNTAEVEVTDPVKGLLSMNGAELELADGLSGRVKGDKIMIAIRPERFSFVTEEKKTNILDCRIENITFLGSVVRIQIEIGGAIFNMDTFNRPSLELPKIGDRRQVTCSRKAVLVLTD